MRFFPQQTIGVGSTSTLGARHICEHVSGRNPVVDRKLPDSWTLRALVPKGKENKSFKLFKTLSLRPQPRGEVGPRHRPICVRGGSGLSRLLTGKVGRL